MIRISTAPPCFGRPSRVIPVALVAWALVWLHPAPALAHGSLAVGDFYSGMLHPLLHFETLLPTLALALWSGQLGGPDSWRLPLAFLGAVLVGTVAGILEVDLYVGSATLRLSMLVLGLLVAVQGKLPAALALAMALLFGLFEGQTHTYDPEATIDRPLLFIAGQGVFLMTGTGIVPPDQFTLTTEDFITITVGDLILQNEIGL